MSDFPTALSEVVDNVDDALAKYINNLEAKVGIDGSAVITSHEYWLQTGWISISDTLVYVSASSFKIEGKDVTSRFPVGTRLKFTQTTDKYATVTSSSFSTDTTVNISVNTDFTIANAAITLPYYSYQSCPQGYLNWFNFTPSWTGITVGSGGTNKGTYTQIGKTVHFKVQVILGTSPSVATSSALILPITANSDLGVTGLIGLCDYRDTGSDNFLGMIDRAGVLRYPGVSGSVVIRATITAIVPFTWAATDEIYVDGTYDIA